MGLNPNAGKTSAQGKFWLALVMAGSLSAVGGLNLTAQAQDQAPAQAPAQDQAAAGERTDGQIEMDVVHALDAAPELKQDWITAATVQGEVTLSGTSGSAANRQLAESIAAKVPGVTKVVNSLTVGDPQTAAAQENANPADQQDQSMASGDAPPPPPSMNGNGAQPGNPGDAPNYPPAYPSDGGGRPMYRPAPPAGYPNGYQEPPVATAPETPHAPVTLAQGTLLRVRTSEPLDNKKAKEGTPVEFTVVRDVYAGGVLAIPRGATVRGVVTKSKNAGTLGGAPELALKVNSLELGGQSYALDSDAFDVKGPNKTGHTVGSAVGGALFGALIGGAVGGGSGAAIGAGAGAVGGTAASAATPGPRVWIPTEALMNFHLNAPITVQPVTQAEANRLAQNAQPARPTLYRRYPYGYPYGYPPPPPPPGYYYRPY